MEVVTHSSREQIVIRTRVRKKFSLKEDDSLVLVEENNAIRLQPIRNLSELWGGHRLKDTGAILKELRKEWDDDLEKNAAL